MWDSGELSEAVLWGAMTYDSTNGSSFNSTMIGANPNPTQKEIPLGGGKARQVTQARGNIEQIMNAGGLAPMEVNMKELLKSGVDLGLPKVND